ncbi:MAG: response regulator transcription factor [Terracidiphilus sp.]
MDRLLIVDDDLELCDLLTERLRSELFETEAVHDGLSGLKRALAQTYSLVVLDLMLPGIGGLEVLRRFRAASSVPVLILTARGEDVDRILGLEIGADDYLGKPFNPRELVARIRAILRRATLRTGGNEFLVSGDLQLDRLAREARLGGVTLALTQTEFAVLELLVQQAGKVVAREQLTEMVLGRSPGPFDRVIDVHVSNIRKKLAAHSASSQIKAMRGSGYLFVPRSEAR